MGKILAARMARTVAALAVAFGALTGAAVVAAPAATASTSASTTASTAANLPSSIETRHATKFARGAWFDQGNGNAYVAAPLRELVPGCGWLPSPWERVTVQERTRHGIRTRATLDLTDTGAGIARGTFHVGGGVHYLRVVHPADFWTLGTVGVWRRVVVTTEPLDVI